MKLLLESWKSYLNEMAQLKADIDLQGNQTIGLEFKKAAEICRAIGDKPLLTRGFQSSLRSGSLYITTEGPAEKGRMSINYKQIPAFRSFIDKLVQKYNLKSIIYCATKGGKFVKMFGTEYIVFPTKINNIIFSDFVGDSGSWTTSLSKSNEDIEKKIQEGVDSYIEGFPPVGKHPDEVIVDAPAYYLINLEWASEWFQRLASNRNISNWKQPPLSKKDIVSSRDKEESDIRKKYGLPPLNIKRKATLKDQMMEVETYSELAEYLDWMWGVLEKSP